jgi:hypothetical protein
LASALFAFDPLFKVRQVLECFLMLKPEQREELYTNPEDRAEIERNYSVAVALMSMEKWTDKDGSHKAIIPWPFDWNDADKYLGFIHVHYSYLDKTKEPLDSPLRFAYQTFSEADLAVCLSVRNQFIVAMREKVLYLISSIHSKFIQPEVWKDALEAMGKASPKEEKKHGDSTGETW